MVICFGSAVIWSRRVIGGPRLRLSSAGHEKERPVVPRRVPGTSSDWWLKSLVMIVFYFCVPHWSPSTQEDDVVGSSVRPIWWLLSVEWKG